MEPDRQIHEPFPGGKVTRRGFLKLTGSGLFVFFTMGGTEYKKATNNITVKIEKSSGKVIDSFGVRAKRNSDLVVKETKKMIKSHLKHLTVNI